MMGPLSFRKGSTVTYGNGKSYTRFSLVEEVRLSTPWDPERGLDLDRTYYEIK